ncbi:MAG: alpha/beta hydrolase [Negativicutes bacterium]|nr:alpha/beta hydrolase [Negativicutes bacterium]
MKTILFTCLLAAAVSLASAAPRNDAVTIPTRTGVTQSVFVAYDDEKSVEQVVLLFPGGNGLVKINSDQGSPSIRIGGNFLVRSRGLFVARGVAAVIVDCPSDQRDGMSDAFRSGKAHATDMSMVVDLIRQRFPAAKVFLVGTSRGTISAAALGESLADKVNGVILTSAVYEMPGFHLPRFSVPALLVHHINDGCSFCPYRSAEQASIKFGLPLITISGGKPPLSAPCEAYSQHGFYGNEQETVDRMVDWIRAQ